jgi:hypothetical protein
VIAVIVFLILIINGLKIHINLHVDKIESETKNVKKTHLINSVLILCGASGQWENEFYVLIRTLLSGYDLPYRIFKLYLWEAFSKVKFYRNRNIF